VITVEDIELGTTIARKSTSSRSNTVNDREQATRYNFSRSKHFRSPRERRNPPADLVEGLRVVPRARPVMTRSDPTDEPIDRTEPYRHGEA